MNRRSPPGAGGLSLRRVAASTIPVTLAVQACSFLSSIALATVLGATTETDAYYLALTIPVLVSHILLGAIRLGAIPALTDLDAGDRKTFDRGCSEFVSAVALGATLLAIPVTALAYAAMPLLSGSDSETISTARAVTVELAPLAVMGAVAGALGAVLTVRGRYLAPIAVIAFEPVAKIVFIVTVGTALGAHALALGNLVGGALAVLTLVVWARRGGIRIGFADPRGSPLLRAVAAVSVPLLLAQAVLQFNPIVDRAMALPLAEGSVTVLELGFRLSSVPTALLASTLIAPIAATWAARQTEGGWPALRASVVRATEVVAVALPPIAALGFVLRHELVTLFYSGGEYASEDVERTADVFGVFMLGLPGQVLVVAYASAFVIRRDMMIPMAFAVANLCLNIALNLLFRPILGVTGIALSSATTLTLLGASYVVLLSRRAGAMPLRAAGRDLLRSSAAAALGGLAAWAAASSLPPVDDRVDALAPIAAGLAAGVAVYVAAMFALGERRLPRLGRAREATAREEELPSERVSP